MLTFVLGLLIYQRTQANTAVSLLYLTVGLPAAIFGIFSGVFVDRFSKKKVLITATLARFILILCLFMFRENLLMLYVLSTAISILSQFFIPAEAALIPTFVPGEQLLSANSLFTLTFYSAIIIGFVTGGPLLAYAGEANIFLILAGLLVVSLILLVLLPGGEMHLNLRKTLELGSVAHDIKTALTFIWENEVVRRAITLVTIAQAVISVFATLGPGFADRILLLKMTDASVLILGPATLGMIIGALFVGNYGDRYRKRQLISGGLYMAGIFLLLVSILARSRHYVTVHTLAEHVFSVSVTQGLLPLSIICFFFLGFGSGLIDVSCNTVLQEQTSEKLRGRVYGILASLIGGVAILPVIVSGVLADIFGIGKIIFGMGVLLLLMAITSSRKSTIVTPIK